MMREIQQHKENAGHRMHLVGNYVNFDGYQHVTDDHHNRVLKSSYFLS